MDHIKIKYTYHMIGLINNDFTLNITEVLSAVLSFFVLQIIQCITPILILVDLS